MLLSPDLTLWEYSPSPEESMPEILYFTPEAYHQRLQERLQLAQLRTSMIRKTILLGVRDADGATLDETAEWLR